MTREEFDKYAIENDLVVWSKEMSERAIKALEQEPKTWRWIDLGDGEYKCPECHREFINGMDIENMTKFFPKCPNCGKKMGSEG